MLKINLRDNIFWGVSVSLLLLVLSSIASYISIRNLNESSSLVENSNGVLSELDEVFLMIKDAETSQRGYLVTGNAAFLVRYDEVIPKINPLIDHVQYLVRDNPTQQNYLDRFRMISNKRVERLNHLLHVKRTQGHVLEESMIQGKEYMDELRNIMREMKQEENSLLEARTEELNAWTRNTPLTILVTVVLALVVSVIFYRRMSADISEKMQLQEELELRNQQMEDRINEIENLAAQVSQGNYSIRFKEDHGDKIGTLAKSLNFMATSLGENFASLENREWLQTGLARLNESLVGQKNLEDLTRDALETIVMYTESQAGAIYALSEDNHLDFIAGYALDLGSVQRRFLPHEGIPGQALHTDEILMMTDIPGNSFSVSVAVGKLKPANVLAMSIRYNQQPVGVIELGAMAPYTSLDLQLLNEISEKLGTAMAASQSRRRLQELLEETQSQSEELQAQTTELENINAELEAQSLKLQASEEELRVQQEELLQSNQELEERAQLLEERNQIIRERNEQIIEKSRELELSSRYKSEFLANMSHELRTPLNSILLLSKLMSENEQLDKEFIEYAEVIQSSGQNLLKLIDEILDLSKIESGKMQLEVTDVRLPEITNSIRKLFAQVAKSKDLDFRIEVDKDTPEDLRTDPQRLEQILRNLLSNAFKFTSKGEVVLTVSPVDDRKNLKFTVKDTGIGVPADMQSIVFEAFQQVDGSTRRKFGGTGLGLSISRELSKLLGGEISLKSEEHKGSEFSLILPVIYSGPREESFPQEQPLQEKTQAQMTSTGTVGQVYTTFDDDREEVTPGDRVILIIEDDAAFAKVLLDYTRQKKYKGIVSGSGEEGLQLARQYRPAAILLDILLPGINGWQVLEELKADRATRHIPVHVMSSLQVKNKSILSGANDFIDKPVGLDKMQQIFRKLEQALQGHDKVLIVEENKPHAQALAYFLNTNSIKTQVATSVNAGIAALNEEDNDCVILDVGVHHKAGIEALETIKNNPGFENLPIIVFTGKNLSRGEELTLKKYADSIVVKTAHSYKRILDEAGLFLHLVEEGERTRDKSFTSPRTKELKNILKGRRIMVVDDDVRNIFSISKALELQHVEVITATDGREAVTAIRNGEKVDGILMDMMMPEMDGYEAIRTIRGLPGFKDTPILAVTAKAMAGDREKCIAAGASDYISKPIDIDQLLSLLRVWLYMEK